MSQERAGKGCRGPGKALFKAVIERRGIICMGGGLEAHLAEAVVGGVYLALQNERSPSGLENVASYGVMVSRFFMARLGARAAYNPALFSSSCCGPDTMRCRLDAQKNGGGMNISRFP